MNNVQLYIGIGLPVIAVLTSLTISLVQISAIRDELQPTCKASAKISARSARTSSF